MEEFAKPTTSAVLNEQGLNVSNTHSAAAHWQTATMAEQFILQGHADRALAIYRALVEKEPQNEHYRERLMQLDPSFTPQGFEPMSFREILRTMVEALPGAQAAVLMGFDGIAIDSCELDSSSLDLPALMVEYSTAAQQLRRVQETMPGVGELKEMNVVCAGNTCLLQPLTSEYFCAFVLGPEALMGKARYLLRITGPKLLSEL